MNATFADVFAGPGGFGLGLSAAGFRCVAAVEADTTTAATYAANHRDVPVLVRDVRRVPACDLQGVARRLTGTAAADVVVGGPPCQIHSVSGKGRREYDPERLYLYREVIRLAVGLDARVLLLENVEGILTKTVTRNGRSLVLDRVRRDLDAAGYSNRREFLLDAADYGLPQRRKRWFCAASREPALRLDPPRPSLVRVSVAEAFADLPAHPGGDYAAGSSGYTGLMRSRAAWPLPPGPDVLTLHAHARHAERMAERFRLVPPGRRLYDVWLRAGEDVRERLRSAGVFTRRPPHKQTAARLRPDAPSRTVTSCCEVHLVHPTRDRIITAREAARLMSFPDGYTFCGPLTGGFGGRVRSVYQQIGSAVPPLMAWAWGTAIRLALTRAGPRCRRN